MRISSEMLVIAAAILLIGILPGCSSYGNTMPCERSREAMESSEGLMAWATENGQGTQEKEATASVEEINGKTDYRCNARNSGYSKSVNGRTTGKSY